MHMAQTIQGDPSGEGWAKCVPMLKVAIAEYVAVLHSTRYHDTRHDSVGPELAGGAHDRWLYNIIGRMVPLCATPPQRRSLQGGYSV